MTQSNLIPRDLFFGAPDRAQARISPDGSHISFIAPVDGVLNVWVGPAGDVNAATPVTQDTLRGIRMHAWAHTGNHILYIQDVGGNEDWHVYATDLLSGETRDLTPFEGVAARIVGGSIDFPNEIVIGLNNRVPEWHDLYRVNISTGESTMIQQNDQFGRFLLDDAFNVRLATQPTPDGGARLLRKEGDAWTELFSYGLEDDMTTNALWLNKRGDKLLMKDSRGRNTSALFWLDIATGEQTLLAENDLADAGMIMQHPTEKTVQGVAFNYERRTWHFFDEAISAEIKSLAKLADGDVEITSRTDDDTQWIVAFLMDNGPIRYYHYNRTTKESHFLFSNRSALENQPLAKMNSVVVKARDGLDLVCYYTLPIDQANANDRPDKPLPTVLWVHGGPWSRNTWGFHPYHQLFANRGYAVLSVNFRGSTGFGKNFVNAGNLEWGRSMHTDLLDAVDWAVEAGITQRDAVAIAGGSYGGYAALAGMTMTPDVFAAGVSIVGPSNLITLINSVPKYWQPMIERFARRMGDHRTEEGRAFLTERSPLTYVNEIRRPLLIAQGANDPRVNQQESDQIVAAMQANNIPVTYVLYPDEGHGFARPVNNIAFAGIIEGFLGAVFEQPFEPLGDVINASSAQVPAGADGVPGLAEALANRG